MFTRIIFCHEPIAGCLMSNSQKLFNFDDILDALTAYAIQIDADIARYCKIQKRPKMCVPKLLSIV